MQGYTITYWKWDDDSEWVAGRFDTKEEVDAFIEKVNQPCSGWTPEELYSIRVYNDKSYLVGFAK